MAELYVARIVRSEGRKGVARVQREAFASSDPPTSNAVVAGATADHVDLYVSPALRRGIEVRHPVLSNARYLAAASHIAAGRGQYLWDVDVALALGVAPNEAAVKQWRKENRVAKPPAEWPARWQPTIDTVEKARLLLSQDDATSATKGSESVDAVQRAEKQGPGGEVSAQVGEMLDGYHLERRLGQGGMGVVFEATEPHINRRVALKVIASHLTHRDDIRQRFLREARTAAAIEHPHALPIYRVGQVGETLYISMRFVDGPNLRDVIYREAFLEPARALRIIEQVGGALDAAHTLQLLHRDVKPQNILLASFGGTEHAYLSDFGLARFIADTGLTRTGESLGTPSYMSPEQFTGVDVGPRADIYALGCVLYESLTGGRPFERDATMAVMYAHVNDPPPRASEANLQLPSTIDSVIERALAKAPEDRYRSAAEFSSAARAALVEEPSSAGESKAPRRPSRTPQSRSIIGSGSVRIVEVREGRTEFIVDGQSYVTGAAGTRCYQDLVSQFGSNEAQRVLGAAPALMVRVRATYPDARPPRLRSGESEVIVEALLLAAGVPDEKIAELARRYRSTRGATVELAFYRR